MIELGRTEDSHEAPHADAGCRSFNIKTDPRILARIRGTSVGNQRIGRNGAVEAGVPIATNAKSRHRKSLAIAGKVGFTVGTDVVTWTLALVSTRNKFVGHTVSTTLARSGAAGIGDLSFTVDSTEERGTNALLSNSRRGAHSTILARLNRAGCLDGKENQKRKGQI